MPNSSTQALDALRRASDYHLRHLAYHLAQAQQTERLYHLLVDSDQWLQAKFARFADDTPYANDLALALQSYTDPPVDRNAVLQRLALWTAHLVVRQRNRVVSERDLVILSCLGRTDEALNLARLQATPQEIYQGLWTVYETLKQHGPVEQALLVELQQVAGQIDEGEARSVAYAHLVNEYGQADQLEEAEQLLASVQSHSWQLAGRLALAQLHIKRGALDLAQGYLQQVAHACTLYEDRYGRVGILVALAGAWQEMGEFDRAQDLLHTTQTTIEEITDPQFAVMAHCVLASALTELQQPAWAKTVFTAALALVPQIELLSMREFTLGLLLDKLLETGVDELYPTTIQAMHYPWMRMAARCTVAAALAKKGVRAETLMLVTMVEDELQTIDKAERGDEAFIYAKLAPVFAALNNWSAVHQTLARITVDRLRREALGQVAIVAATTRQITQAGDLYAQYRTLPVEYPLTWQQVRACCMIAVVLHRWGEGQHVWTLLQAAQTATAQLTDVAQQMKAIKVLTNTLHQLTGIAAVWALVTAMPAQRSEILLALAMKMTPDEAIENFPVIDQQLHGGTPRAELWGLWALALTQCGDLLQAETRLAALTALDEQLMSVLRAAAAATEEPVKLDDLFSRLLTLETKAHCAIVLAYLRKGEQAKAGAAFERCMTRLATIMEASALIAPVTIVARALCEIDQQPAAALLIERAQRLAQLLQPQEQRDRALQALANYALDLGQWSQAEQIMLTMDRTASSTQQLLSAIIANTVAQGDVAKAMQTWTQITDAEIRTEASLGLAALLWQRGEIAKALTLHQAVSLDDYITHISQLLLLNNNEQNHAQMDVSKATIWQIIRIAGWVDATWRQIGSFHRM
jgi:tetratricopeptide (TPR) repeat protein